MRLRSGKSVLVIGTFLCFPALPATAQRSVVLALPDDVTVEVIGLRRWTIDMVQDSLGKYAPSDSLQSHACAATLRYTLHFADAASTEYSYGPDKPIRIVVIVREPQDSARVHFRAMPLDTLSPRKAWRPISDVFRYHPNVFWPALYAYLLPSHITRPQYQTAGDSAVALRFTTSLHSLNRERDRLEAVRALQAARNMYDRVAAALILANFTDRDDSWTTLAETLRERDGWVKGVAATVLTARSERSPRKVNWSPAATGIHAMLDGTSLFVLDQLMQVLTATKVGPADARAMLGNHGGEMLLAFVGSHNPSLSSHSRALLTALRGADLGADPDVW